MGRRDQEQASLAGKRARVHGSPGERARLQGLLYAVWALVGVAALGGYLLGSVCPLPGFGSTGVGVLFLCLALAVAVCAQVGRGRLDAFLKGARGEEWVARELSLLPAGYVVLHGLCATSRAIRPRGADFDHVVLGPNGVFVVETKSWRGTVTVRDDRLLCAGAEPSRAPLEQVRLAAESLAAELAAVFALPPAVQPVLCLATDTVADSPRRVNGVTVCNRSDLLAVLLGATGAELTPADLLAAERRLQSPRPSTI